MGETASKVWRRGQNIQGFMPQNILGTARVQVDFPALPEKTDEGIKGFPEGFFSGGTVRTVPYRRISSARKITEQTM
ncbi:MAG: hypothetical protein IIW81_03320 [Oscillospiraceae bacterium]|nr:hypothetical protein [Oscillospiraceae bacterium]